MLLNAQKIRQEKLKETFYEQKKSHPEWQCMDQDVHNIVFKEKITWLSPRYNLQYFNFHVCSHTIEDINQFYDTQYSSFEEMLNDGAIIHLTNYQKPWEYRQAPFHDEWKKYFKLSPLSHKKLKYKDKKSPADGIIRIEKKEGKKCCTLNLKLYEKLKTDKKRYIKLLGLPLYKKVKQPQKHAVSVMGIPVYKKKIKEKTKRTYILGIPLLKTKQIKGKTRRYVLGLPVKTLSCPFKYQRDNAKVNLLFDASVLPYGGSKTPARSGVYFVIYNVVKGFLNDTRLNLALCCGNKKQQQDLKEVFKRFYKGYQMPPVIINDNVPENMHLFDAYFTPLYAIPEYIAENQNIIPYDIFYDLDPVVHPDSFPDSKNKDFWFTKLVESLNSRSVNFVISKYTRKDFLKYVPKASAKNTITTLLAADRSFHKTSYEETLASLKKYNLPTGKKYIFSLCNLQPRKNLIRVIRTFLLFIKKHNINDMVFILGGAAWSTFESEFADELSKPECQGKVIHAGYIDDNDLAPLYSGAHWFVYTSSFEGFGLPPLEAMQCGCPVITSNNTSLPEVVGRAGIMIDYDSDMQHISAYEKYYFDNAFRTKMANKGLKQAQKFSWDKCVNIMADKIVKNNREKRI